MFLCKCNILNTHVPPWDYPGNSVLTLQRCELWVTPSGKVSRNVELQKVVRKGSKCQRESHHVPDDLPVGQPEGLTDVTAKHLKVCECVRVDIEIWDKHQNVKLETKVYSRRSQGEISDMSAVVLDWVWGK